MTYSGHKKARVLHAKAQFEYASTMDIAEMCYLPESTVRRILRARRKHIRYA